MRVMILTVVAAFALMPTAVSADTASDRAQIDRVYQDQANGILSYDLTPLYRVRAPGFTALGTNGEVDPSSMKPLMSDAQRQHNLAVMRPVKAKIAITRFVENGDTATVAAAYEVRFKGKYPKTTIDKFVELRSSSVDTWRRGPNGWVMTQSWTVSYVPWVDTSNLLTMMNDTMKHMSAASAGGANSGMNSLVVNGTQLRSIQSQWGYMMNDITNTNYLNASR